MKRAPSAASHAAGLSLVELLISLVIGLVLMLGVTQIFMASRAASQLSEGVARTQENARFALEFLERDIRMAGHMGCVNDQAHLVRAQDSVKVNIAGVKSGDGSPMDFSVPIQGYEAQGTAPGNKLTLGASWGGCRQHAVGDHQSEAQTAWRQRHHRDALPGAGRLAGAVHRLRYFAGHHDRQ